MDAPADSVNPSSAPARPPVIYELFGAIATVRLVEPDAHSLRHNSTHVANDVINCRAPIQQADDVNGRDFE